MAWVGLRGATPIILATFPLLEGVEGAALLFDVVFFVVIISVAVQGTTIGWVARRLGASRPAPPDAGTLLEPGRPLPDGTALRGIDVPPGSGAAGRALVDLHLPSEVLIVLVQRESGQVVPTGSTEIEAGDHLMVLADDAGTAILRKRLAARRP